MDASGGMPMPPEGGASAGRDVRGRDGRVSGPVGGGADIAWRRVAAWLDGDLKPGHRRVLPYNSMDVRPYQVIKNIPVVIRYRPWWTGGRHR